MSSRKIFCADCKRRIKPGNLLQAFTGAVDGVEYDGEWRCYDCDRKKASRAL